MLHLHNGDSTAGTARQANIPGEHIAWREALVCGPTPAGLSEPEFIDTRARHLADSYSRPVEKCRAELRAMHEALASFSEHDEVVLWFEHDLFCQIQLIYLLHWFAGRDLGRTKLSLICIDEFPGIQIFHGLGQLNEEQLLSLFLGRREITFEQLELAAKGWAAYCAPDAVALIALINSDMSALPFLKEALSKHLQRFPSTRNGLGRVENEALKLIPAGYGEFRSLFPAFIRREGAYGFGDAQLYVTMRSLTMTPKPLLNQKRGPAGTMDPLQILLSSFEITDHGKAVLAGEQDFVITNGIDKWLGGIHLRGKESAWRWDDESQQLLVSL